ncbi:FHA domain-containing protein [Sanguibacter sp. YZGR15]|uniref:FHA domain-containing protein n=2 Tax=Sanguibacter suaedae TaxID=2795737 RepID=A0A934IBS2_9MICO|nr:FHA domain-containing protein [Sanguibacter suaedae]
MAQVLDAVTESLDPTWRALPSFAVVVDVLDAGLVHVAARGDLVVEVLGDEPPTLVAGKDVTTWTEQRHEAPHGLVVRGADAVGAPAGDDALLLASGIVTASHVAWGSAGSAGDLDGTAVTDAPTEVTPVPVAASKEVAEDVPAAEGVVETLEVEVEDVPEVPEAPEAPEVQDAPEAPDDDLGLPDGLDPAEQAELEFGKTLADFPDDLDPADHDPVAAPGAPPPDDDLDDLDDSTVLSPGGPPVVPPPAGRPAPSGSPGPVPPPPPPPVEYGVVVPPGSPGFTAGVYDPPAARGALPPPAAAPAGPPTPADPAGPGPQILARSCYFGHPNPPVRMTCARCGGGLSPNAELVERPALGRVRFSHGEVVELGRHVVVGRFPQEQAGSGARPHLVSVESPSQDVSRSHLEIRLEGWHVLLVDLDTVNGTTLLRAGQAPRRLHPLEPTLVADGDVVDLGDGVVLTFEGVV